MQQQQIPSNWQADRQTDNDDIYDDLDDDDDNDGDGDGDDDDDEAAAANTFQLTSRQTEANSCSWDLGNNLKLKIWILDLAIFFYFFSLSKQGKDFSLLCSFG